MSMKNLFLRDITRSINGVVKADQLDEVSVWQELDEYVVTQEIEQHLRELVDALVTSIDRLGDPTSTNGVWISGFFGSGKSHFIKVLSYLLENEPHRSAGTSRQAIEFFDGTRGAVIDGDPPRGPAKSSAAKKRASPEDTQGSLL